MVTSIHTCAITCICVLIFQHVAAAASGPTPTDTASIEARLSEIRDTWKIIISSVKACSYESTMRLSRGERAEPQIIATERRRKVMVTPSGFLSESRTHLTKGGKRTFDGHIIYLVNDHYSCSLLDRTDDGRFIITDVPKMIERKWSEEIDSREKLSCCLPWLFPTNTFNVMDFIDSRISVVTGIDDIGNGLLKITFAPRAGLSKGDAEKFGGVTSGILFLNSKWHFRLESAELRFDPAYSQTSTMRFKYSDVLGDEHLLTEIIDDTTFIRPGDKVSMTARCEYEYDCRYNIEYDPRQFYISHYGLPEVVDISPPTTKTPRYIWLLLVAVALGIISLLLRWFTVKRRATVAPIKA